MADNHSFLRVLSTRGGRNGYDSPHAIGPNQVVEAMNVDWVEGECGGKRRGSSALSLSGSPFTTILSTLARHTPTADDSAAEFWGVDGAAHVGRYASGAWSTPSLTDAISASYQHVSTASLNGKFFLAYKSAQDRLHVWDGTSVRRVGLPTPTAAPTAANQGAGAYAAILRYYKVRWVRVNGSEEIRSEMSSDVPFTPSGGGASVRVTRPTAPGEGETHWDLFGSFEDENYYSVARIAIGTSFYDDSTINFNNGILPDDAGTNVPPISGKFLLVDENRLLIGGSWESNSYASRVSFTPVIGSAGVGDDERTMQTTEAKHWLDLDAGKGGGLTGLAGPLNGSPYAFKASAIFKLVRTGNVNIPYFPITVSKTIGAATNQGIVSGEDEAGNACLYFWSKRGPYRLGPRVLEYIGADIEDITKRVNLDATTIPVHGVYHADIHQVWFWLAVDGANEPNLKVVFDVREGRSSGDQGVRNGWSVSNGLSAAARCSVMAADTFGATMGSRLKPYIGQNSSGAAVWKCDADGVYTDNGTAYQAYQTTRHYPLAGFGVNSDVVDAHLVAKAAEGVDIQLTITRDFGKESRPSTCSLTPEDSETYVQVPFGDSAIADAGAVQFTIGDEAAIDNHWVLEALIVAHRPKAKR
jgi:hypothetical protein